MSPKRFKWPSNNNNNDNHCTLARKNPKVLGAAEPKSGIRPFGYLMLTKLYEHTPGCPGLHVHDSAKSAPIEQHFPDRKLDNIYARASIIDLLRHPDTQFCCQVYLLTTCFCL
jgi:hypothetical protein